MTCTTRTEMLCSFKDLSKFAIAIKRHFRLGRGAYERGEVQNVIKWNEVFDLTEENKNQDDCCRLAAIAERPP